MRPIEEAIVIAGPPEVIWDVLTDFRHYPDWSVFIHSIEGSPVVDSRLRVTMGLEGKRTFKGTPRVVASDHGRKFAWAGHLGSPALFASNHEFILSPDESGNTRLVHRETFTGLIPMLAPFYSFPQGHAGFRAFNESLKCRAEARAIGYRD